MTEEKKSISDKLQRLAKKYFVSTKVLKRLVVTTALFWVPAIVFLAIADEIKEQEPIPGEEAILRAINQLSSPTLDSIMITLTNTSGPLQAALIAALIISLLFLFKKYRAATYMLFSVGGAALINILLKLYFARDRPDLWATVITETSYSFPSGHAMGSAALAGSLIILLWSSRWRWYILAIGSLYVITIGFSRMYLGVHYPTDIIAGWSLSIAWVVIVKLVLDHYRTVRYFIPHYFRPEKNN